MKTTFITLIFVALVMVARVNSSGCADAADATATSIDL